MDISSKGHQFRKKFEVDKFLQQFIERIDCLFDIAPDVFIDNWFNQLDDLIREDKAEDKDVIFYALDRFLKVRGIIKHFPGNFKEKLTEFLNKKEDDKK